MREDAKKLLCLRARRGGDGYDRKYSRRKERWNSHPEDAPSKASMKRYHVLHWGGKQLSEYFPAIEGFLRKSVGRPWNKVYSEICAHCDKRSATGIHMFQHLFNWVELHVVMIKGKPYYYVQHTIYRKDGLSPLEQRKWGIQLYVHPETGILSQAPLYKRKRGNKAKPTFYTLDNGDELHLRKGIWYAAVFEDLPPLRTSDKVPAPSVYVLMEHFKCLLKGDVNTRSDKRRCTKLQQLSSKELRRHSLQNEK